MEKEKIIKSVNGVFIKYFELPEKDLTPEAEIFAGLGLDSLDIVDLMVGLQEQFGVSLRQNEEIRKVRTLGDVYAFFKKLSAENPELAQKIAAME